MEQVNIGDLVVLTSGSMRMAVEGVDGTQVACVWCHEGKIGRETFDARLLKKWEVREEDSRGPRPEGGPRPYRSGGGDRDNKPPRPVSDGAPRGKPGWDGKPREKKFFRKDG